MVWRENDRTQCLREVLYVCTTLNAKSLSLRHFLFKKHPIILPRSLGRIVRDEHCGWKFNLQELGGGQWHTDSLGCVEVPFHPVLLSVPQSKQVNTHSEPFPKVRLLEESSKHSGNQSCQQAVSVSTVVFIFFFNKTNRRVTYLKMF